MNGLLSDVTAVLLDVDGTLFSSEEMLHDVYRQAIADFQKRHSRPKTLPDLPAIMAQIGQPVKTIFKNLLPELSDSERDEISNQVLVDLVRRIGKGEGIHYEGVNATLRQLHDKGILLFAASNGRQAYVDAVLKAGKVFDLFKAVPTIDHKRIKNKDDLVRSILDDYDLQPAQCVMVGDRTTDRDAALSNHVAFVATSYGHHGDVSEHQGAVATIDSFKQLAGLLGVE